MAQLFHPSINVISKLSIVALVGAIPVIGAAVYFYNQNYPINLQVPLVQPVQFSHKHHVGDDGIDCRYCHTSVDKSSFAGVPPTHTCMTCHSQLWKESPLLEPVRESFRTGKPIHWKRVHDLPDFVYFNHSIHVKKGVGCVSCHGRVDEMPLTRKEKDLTMRWCLDCHRNPEKFIRPREHVYDLAWKPENVQEKPAAEGAGREKSGGDLVREYRVLNSFQLTNCSTCHR